MRISDWSSDVCSSDLGRLTSKRMAITERTTAGSNSMWGGRFAEGPASIMREINASIPFDKRLWRQDIAGSKAHVAMLAKQGIVSAEDAAAISGRLDQIAAEYEAGGLVENLDLEDIHMPVEARLAEIVRPAAGSLHTRPEEAHG